MKKKKKERVQKTIRNPYRSTKGQHSPVWRTWSHTIGPAVLTAYPPEGIIALDFS